MKKLKRISTRGKILNNDSQDSTRFNNIQNIIQANTESEVSPYLSGGLGYFGTDAYQIDHAGSPRNSNISSEIPDDENIVSETWDGISSIPGFMADTYRQLLKRVYESWQGEDEQQLLHLNDQKEDLDLVKSYRELSDTYTKIKDKIDYLKNYHPNDPSIANLEQYLGQLDESLTEQEKYFKSPAGRQSNVVLDLMYNYDKMDAKDNAQAGSMFLTKDSSARNTTNNKNLGGIYGVLNGIGNVASDVFGYMSNAFNMAVYGASKLMPGSDYDNNLTKDVLRSIGDNNPLVDKLFRGREYSSIEGQFSKNAGKINNWDKYLKDSYQEAADAQKAHMDVVLNGNMLFDPRRIDPTYAKRQQDLAGELSFTGLAYAIPELGSSLSMVEGMALAGGVDRLSRWMMNIIPAIAVGNKKAAAEKILQSGITGAKAATAAEQLYQANKTAELIKGAILSADVTAGIQIAKNMRVDETMMEEMDAISSRTMLDAQKNNADFAKVLTNIQEWANDNHINIKGLDLQKIISLALAYNIPTGDDAFERAKKNSRKGIQKLINNNNALAYTDYLQTLPYMSYGGNVLKAVGNSFVNNGPAWMRVGLRSSDEAKGIAQKIRSIGSNLKTDYAAVQRTKFMNMPTDIYGKTMYDKVEPHVRALFGNLISSASRKLIQKDMPRAGLALQHIAKWATPDIKKLVPTMFIEGSEEGVQHLLQQRYQRGEYDNYDHTSSMFNVPDVLDDMMITSQALGDYLGINTGDPDNASDQIRKVMNIGSMVAMFFPMAQHAATNFVPSDADNIRNLAGQLKTDWVINKVIGDNYGRLEDQKHAGIFFDAFHKTGVTPQRLATSLNDLKGNGMTGFKDELVSDEFIDKDIQLMYATYHAFKNPHIEEFIKNHGFEKYGPEHRTLVQQAAVAIADPEMTKELISDASRNLIQELTHNENLIDTILSDSVPDEEKDKIFENNPKLKSVLLDLNRLFQVYTQDIKESNQKAEQDLDQLRQDTRNKYDAMSHNKLARDKKAVDFAKKKLIEAGEDQESLNNEHILYEKTRQFFKDPSNKEEFIDNAVGEIVADNIDAVDKRSYMSSKSNLYNVYQMLNRARALKVMFQQREKIQDTIRKITGLDINGDNIRGIIHYVESQEKDIEKELLAIVNGKSGKTKIEDIDRMLGDLDYEFDNQDDINLYTDRLIINKALYEVQRKLANAYLFGAANPISLNKAIYGSEDAESPLKETANEYERLISTIASKSEMEEHINDEADEVDKEALQKEAFEKLISDRLKNELQKRERVTHRLMEEEPLTNDDIENAENGDQQSQEKVESAAKDVLRRGTQTSVETDVKIENNRRKAQQSAEQISEQALAAEKRLSEQYEYNNQRQEERILNNIEKMRQRQQKVDDGMEAEQENNVPETAVPPVAPPVVEQPIEPLPEEKQPKPEHVEQPSKETPENNGDSQRGKNDPLFNDVITWLDPIADTIRVSDICRKYTIGFLRAKALLDAYNEYKEEQINAFHSEQEGGLIKENSSEDQAIEQGNDHQQAPDSPRGTEPMPMEDENEYEPGPDPTEPTPEEEEEEDRSEEIQAKVDELLLTSQSGESSQEIEKKLAESEVKSPQQKIEERDLLEEAAAIPGQNMTLPDVDLDGNVSTLDYINGVMYKEGIPMDYGRQEAFLAEMGILDSIDNGGVFSLTLPKSTVDGTKDTQSSDEAYDYTSSVFFYQPNPKVDPNTGEDELVHLKQNGRDIKLKYPIRSGRELAKNLIRPGWFQKCNKYYVVSQSIVAQGAVVPEDGFTVSMIIEDDELQASYVCTLRELGKYQSEGKDGRTYIINKEQELRDRLETIRTNIDFSEAKTEQERKALYRSALQEKIESFVRMAYQNETGNIEPSYDKYDSQEAFEKAWDAFHKNAMNWYQNPPKRRKNQTDDQYNTIYNHWLANAKQIKDRARRELGRKDIRPLTEEQIDAQINALRTFRNQIIDAYCAVVDGVHIIPNEVRRDIKPDPNLTSISNGRIDNDTEKNEFDEDVPARKKVNFDGNPFGMSNDIEELSEQISNGQVMLGLGLGYRGSSQARRESRRYPIRNLLRDAATGRINGRGLSGKIYAILKGVGGSLVPIMLMEQKLNTQVRKTDSGVTTNFIGNTNDGLRLCIDPNNGEVIDNDGYLPSTAEVILYLLMGGKNQLNPKMFPGGDVSIAEKLADIFIHTGEETILKRSLAENSLFNALSAKQITVRNDDSTGNKKTLLIAIPNENGYKLTSYTADELFADTEDAVQNRMTVVRAIASQMHWNTDDTLMNARLNSPELVDIINALQRHWRQNPSKEDSTFRLFGLDQLSFNKEDLFDVDQSGMPIRTKGKEDSILFVSWLIHSGKLQTDISSQGMRDPFIFSKGIEGLSSTKEELDSIKKTQPEETVPSVAEAGAKELSEIASLGVDQDETEKQKRIQEKFGSAITPKFFDQTVKDIILESNETRDSREHGGLQDIYILDVDSSEDLEDYDEGREDRARQRILDKLDQAIEYLNKKNGTNISKDNIEKRIDTLIETFADGEALVILKVYKDQHGQLSLAGHNSVKKMKGATGVFSKVRGSGIVDVESAKKWLNKTLGIDDSNVIVTNGVMRSFENEAVYGLTVASLDSIYGEVVGNIMISSQSGAGVEYHEAWHYVNLLLHNKLERNAIYKDFAKAKGFDPDTTIKADIEEEMAEDFRRWMLMQQDNSVKGKIRRWYNNVLDFVLLSRRKSLYRAVYKEISKGGYRFAKLDEQSAKEFMKRWPQGRALSDAYIPGVNNAILENMNSIESYHEFYETCYSLVNYLFDEFKADTVEKIQNIGGKNFEKSLKQIKYLADEMDDYSRGVLMDVYNNPQAFRRIMLNVFQEYGLVPKFKKFPGLGEGVESGEDENEEAYDKEERSDNDYDTFQLTISKKDSAGFRAKLFLRSIQQYKIVPKKNGKKSFIPVYDNIFGATVKYVKFGEAWNRLSESLWQCSSYDEIDPKTGDYDSNSIRGVVKQQAENDPFMYAVNKKLEEIDDDTELKSQIYSSITAANNIVSYLQLEDKTRKSGTDLLLAQLATSIDVSMLPKNSDTSADRDRIWRLQSSNTFRAVRNIPRRWSKRALTVGMVQYKDGKNIVDANFAKSVEKQINSIVDLIDKVTLRGNYAKDQKAAIKVETNLAKLQKELIDLYNYIGIPFDQQTFNYFVDNYNPNVNTNTTEGRIKIIDSILSEPSPGNIRFIAKMIVDSSGKDTFNTETRRGRSIQKELSQLFEGFKETSDISKMALAMNAIHPTSQEFSVRLPNGSMAYPINQNNFITDRVRDLNTTAGNLATVLSKSPYARRSHLLQVAKEFRKNVPTANQIKLNVFVGLKDANRQLGGDYFEITPMEDYLAKMIMLDQDPNYNKEEVTQLVFPTMADKKTWYSIACRNLRTSHDAMLAGPDVEELENAIFRIYSTAVESPLEVELSVKDSTKDTKKNIALEMMRYRNRMDEWYQNEATLEQRNLIYKIAEENTLASGKLIKRFSTNTLSRFADYFLDELDELEQYYSRANVNYIVNNPNKALENYHGSVKNGRLQWGGNGGKFRYFYDLVPLEGGDNLNQHLEYLFQLQKMIEAGISSDQSKTQDSPFKNIGIGNIAALDDGKLELDGFELIRAYIKHLKNEYTTYGQPSEELLDLVNKKLINQTEAELYRLSVDESLKLVQFDNNSQRYIPIGIPSQLLQRYGDRLQKAELINGRYKPYSSLNNVYDADALYSLVANHVANYATSIIEIEKVFMGDPAYYKYKDIKGQFSTKEVTYTTQLGDGISITKTISVSNLNEKDSDKTKRLGAGLSPGNEMRLQYNERELAALNDDTLNTDKYTNLNIEDVQAASLFLNIKNGIKDRFKKQLLVNYIRSEKPKFFDKFLKTYKDKKGKTVDLTFERGIDMIYNVDGIYEKLYNQIDVNDRIELRKTLKQQIKPYKNITVADAQAIIRPELYRKIRIGLGEWSIKRDKTGYSDERAYQILMGDSSWMSDPEKYKIVQKFEAYVLKMTYFDNNSREFADGKFQNVPVYNKMAIFPLFKYMAGSSVGRELYNRMHMEGNELDMISFKSAVKVGGVKNAYSPYKDKTKSLDTLKEGLNKKSDKHIDYTTGEVSSTQDKDALGVTVQSLTALRKQLNTKEHESHSRAIGTQMFKIAFSNIIDNAMYGTKQKGREHRLGSDIKSDIMRCINALTTIGARNVRNLYFDDSNRIRSKAVQKLVQIIAKNNGLGHSAEEILQNGGVVASLMSRKVFENSVSKAVNSEVIKINTKGGTAIQQSMFGLNGLVVDKSDIQDEGWKYPSLNGGKELKYETAEGAMQIFLSANFFKSVVPEEFQDSTEHMREWLLDNNVIGDHAKPFGVGYRIPTQGMSSMFVFQVADIIPEQSGDLIVVPREFTAQTGSDFDIDKLFLATMSYNNGLLETITDDQLESFVKGILPRTTRPDIALDQAEEELANRGISDENVDIFELLDLWEQKQQMTADQLVGAIGNRLLLNYIDIIRDTRNYANAHASIDVLTNKIHDEVLPYVRKSSTSYAAGMYELSPAYQSLKKQEFSTGKDGIGPFALNITNLSLTQFTHLCMHYGDEVADYNFGDLDAIQGQDRNYIADWLSAMVNAHVDVAKDPYVFALNVNKLTYSHANFLIRAGKGLSTFTFLAQPILKLYAARVNNGGGIYGKNIDGFQKQSSVFDNRKNNIRQQLMKEHLESLKYLNEYYSDYLTKEQKIEMNSKIAAIELDITSKSSKDKKKNKYEFDKSLIFDSEYAKKQIANYTSKDPYLRMTSLVYQIGVIKAFQEISKYADLLSNLVNASQVDTEKFGNNIASQINFVNKYNLFKYGNADSFYIKGKEPKNEEDVTFALRYYFGKTFLDKKLYTATKLTRDILSHQTFTATEPFDQIFKSICGLISGSTTYTEQGYNKKGKFYSKRRQAFNPIFDDKIIQSVAQGIDNMMRFDVLMYYGPSIYRKERSKYIVPRETSIGFKSAITSPIKYVIRKLNLDNSWGIIDFTMNGNKNAVRNKFKQLVFGDNEQKSIIARLSEFQNYILQNPESEAAEGLVEDGNIINDMLLYLNPQPPTDAFPIGRIMLNESQMNTDLDKKDVLMSSFYQLLTHPNKNVRMLARDVAFYAYYSTYDTNTVNSFFDLVPPEFRVQYDLSMRKALNGDSKNIINAISPTNKGIFDDDQYGIAAKYLDIISRNYWYDDSIVSEYKQWPEQKRNVSKESGELRDVNIYDSKSKKSFSGLIITTSANSALFKVRKGNGQMLYKRVGHLVKRTSDGTKNTNWNIYMAVGKAGTHYGANHQFEFFCDFNVPSMFEENKIPANYNPFSLRTAVYNNIKSYPNIEAVYDQEFIPMFMTSSNTEWFKERAISVDMQNDDNTVQISVKKDPQKFSKSNKNTLDIEFGKQDESDTIGVTPSTKLQDIIDDIPNKINDKKSGIYIYIHGNDLEFTPTKSVLDKYVKDKIKLQTDQFIEANPDASDEDISYQEQAIAEHVSQTAERELKIKKVSEFIDNLIATIIAEGYKVNTIYTSDMSDTSVAALNAARGYVQQMVYGKANSTISAQDYKNYQQYREFLSNISGDIVELDSNNEEQIETIQQIDDSIQSAEQQADKVVEKAVEEVNDALREQQQDEEQPTPKKKGLSKLRSGGQVDITQQLKIEKAASEASAEAEEGKKVKEKCENQ